MLKPEYRPGYRLGFFVLLIACAVMFSGCVKDRKWERGAPAPEISVLDLGDRMVKLSDYRGKPVVLRFWATGCKACVAAMPELDAYSKRYAGKGLVVLAVNMGNSKELVEAFATGLKLSYPILLDPALITAKKYGIKTVPTTCFIDRQGIARMVVAGELTQNVFDRIVGELL